MVFAVGSLRSLVHQLQDTSPDRGTISLQGKIFMVGVRGFEPPASASRTQRSTRLSHTPTQTESRED